MVKGPIFSHGFSKKGRSRLAAAVVFTGAREDGGGLGSADWLDMDLIIPFKIGDFAEARSFVAGFTGAWFRCKINDIRVVESGRLEYYLEYIDYTEEAKEWTEVFQNNPRDPACHRRKSRASSHMMLRPPFPQWCQGEQNPEHLLNSKLIASARDTWKVGDCVDWFCEGCYWTAKIIRLLSEDEVEVQLLKPPLGEGGVHRVNPKDLRPALDWSMVDGWTVPLSKARGRSWYAVCLIHPKSDIEENTDGEMTSDDDEEEGQNSLRRASNATNCVSRTSNPRDTIMTSTEILKPTSASKSVGNQQGTCRSSKRQASSMEHVPGTVKGAMSEPNGLSNGAGAQQYALRTRKHMNNRSIYQK
ncbi:uncharacterized protein LOC100822630 [Brachypodium distachyon]|nr:uncharacterized protein LOC100822630 [Brachypodium distachyon]|eukprot:XP_010231739.2 uncharacterized protein LOC100822630 [Brachypodium distachyon]